MNYFYQPDISGGVHTLGEEESRHCIRVLRHKKGDLILVLDGKGRLYKCELISADSKVAEFRPLEITLEETRTYHLHLGIAPTKNMNRIEWLVEKSIEVGIDHISFLKCEHSERRTINMDRIRKKAITALKQSGNLFLPEISDLMSFNQFIDRNHDTSHLYICHAETEGGNTFKKIIMTGQKYVVLVGPEGDFSDSELKKASDSGYSVVFLGNNRLRTETAGLVVSCQLHMIHI